MKYKFYSDTLIEEPFFLEIAQELGGVPDKKGYRGFPVFVGVQCPYCQKKKAQFKCSDPTKGKKYYEKDTFVLLCPVEICSNYGGTTLDEVIKKIGSKETQESWRKARWQETWKGIKNRVPYEERKPKRRRTFKDKLDVKTQTSFIRVTGESPDLGCRPTNP